MMVTTMAIRIIEFNATNVQIQAHLKSNILLVSFELDLSCLDCSFLLIKYYIIQINLMHRIEMIVKYTERKIIVAVSSPAYSITLWTIRIKKRVVKMTQVILVCFFVNF
jgi:hypothetical protein